MICIEKETRGKRLDLWYFDMGVSVPSPMSSAGVSNTGRIAGTEIASVP